MHWQTFQSSKSIDTDSSPHQSMPLATKVYESMSNLTQMARPSLYANKSYASNDKSLSRPRMPMIRDKSAPSTSHLDPSMSQRTATAAASQNRLDMNRPKLSSVNNHRCRGRVKIRGKLST
jgi:hypothetical protein